METYTLGLDLGSSSVGWAMIAADGGTFENGLPVLAGVRVFPEGVQDMNTSKEQPRGQARREARGQRRTHYRRRQRRQELLAVLREAGMLPRKREALDRLLATDPYPLRASGLDGKLPLQQFARVLYHICQRRGFKSNRKQGKAAEDGKVRKATAQLQEDITQAQCRTLGEYLKGLAEAPDHRNDAQRVRNRYTLRAMFEHEFEALWTAQGQFHVDVLTDELKEKVHRAIFHQRPLRFDPDVIGDCELEEGEKRCPRAHWLGQEFRMLQEINLLETFDSSTGEVRKLDADERAKLADALRPKKKLAFDEIRTVLGFHGSQTFNLEERSKRNYLAGNAVEAALRNRELRAWYEELPKAQREAVYDALTDVDDPEEMHRIAAGEWGLTDKQADRILKTSLPKGHFRVSLKAIRNIIPHLRSGHIYSEAKELAGYADDREVEMQDSLPPVDEAVRHLTNPLVHRALSETRRVVNAIIRAYGKPQDVVIELARDIKNSRQRRRDIFFDNRKHNQENEEARRRLIEEFAIVGPSRDDVIRYKLWEECNRTCVYTGRPIPKSKLFTEVQVEHIFPYSRSLDDSYMNKTLCYADENRRRKGNRTPYEAYHDEPELYEEIQQRVRRLPYPKRRRFTQKEIDLDKCVQRQLNDTRYISRAAVDYLRILGCSVRSVKGQTTSELRHQWGLNSVLNPGAANMKARDDHRHHAVDAAVVAMTTRSALQKLSTVKYNPERPTLPPPWESFRDDVAKAVDSINVSHRPARKLAGKLHEDTVYGRGSAGKAGTLRVPVGDLSPKMLDQIRDPRIRQLVREAVTQACRKQGPELAGSQKVSKVLGETVVRMPSGVPVRKVRIERIERTLVPLKTDAAGSPLKAVKPGSNHHVEIYEKADGTWSGECISRFQAYERLRKGEPVVNREPSDGTRFVMSLCRNDMVIMSHRRSGPRTLYRVQKMSAGDHKVVFRLHTAARIGDPETGIDISSWEKLRSLEPKKVTVDPLGRIHAAND